MTLLLPAFLPTQPQRFQPIRQLQMRAANLVRSGVLGKSDFFLNPGGSGISVTVSAGEAFVNGTTATRQGSYHIVNDANVTVSGFAAADGTNPRLDLLYLQANDSSISGSTDTPGFVIAQGTPTAGATLANANGRNVTVPPNSMLIGAALIPPAAVALTAANLGGPYKPWLGAAGGFVQGAPAQYAYGRPYGVVPAARVWTNQTLVLPGTNTPTQLVFNAKDYDSDGMWNSVTNPSRLTVSTPGLYRFNANLLTNVGVGGAYALLRLNQSTTSTQGQVSSRVYYAVNAISSAAPDAQIQMGYGDWMELVYVFGGGTNVNSYIDPNNAWLNPWLAAQWIGAGST